MLRLSVDFSCYFIFREENLHINVLLENSYKMTHKVLPKHSQNATKNIYNRSVFTIMDQHEPVNTAT